MLCRLAAQSPSRRNLGQVGNATFPCARTSSGRQSEVGKRDLADCRKYHAALLHGRYIPGRSSSKYVVICNYMGHVDLEQVGCLCGVHSRENAATYRFYTLQILHITDFSRST